MTLSLRPVLTAAAVLCGATFASAQAPGLRPVILPPTTPRIQMPQIQTQPAVRSVGTISPVPIVVQQQQQALTAAYNNALLWQMYQPPVIVTPYPYNPWVYYPFPPLTCPPYCGPIYPTVRIVPPTVIPPVRVMPPLITPVRPIVFR